MCGITGKLYFTPNKKVRHSDIHTMNERIKHRGPDDEGIYINPSNSIGLGHRRLSIIDLSQAGHEPMTNEDGTVWLTYNGEIYNFLELKQGLLKKGHIFKSNTDAEVIVHLWEEHGEDTPKFLRGMFAFAIWDERKKKLFLARDRVGKKPLKYYIGKDFIVFSSELKSFLKNPEVPHEIDHVAIHQYLTFQYVPHPSTGFKGIKKLPAAHSLSIDTSNGFPIIGEPTRYWLLDYSNKLTLSENEWEELIIKELNECVRLRMLSDVPLGAFLSGGVDSSAIVALMAQNSNLPIKTFSIGFSNKESNELPYAKTVSEKYKTDHREFIVEPNAIDILPQLVYHYEEPYADSSALPSFYLAQMTRKYVTVALNGDGGDENFAGYPWYQVMNIASLYNKTPHFIRKANNFIVNHIRKSLPHSLLFRYGAIYTKGSLLSPAYMHTELLSYLNEQEKGKMYNDKYLGLLEKYPSWKFLEHYYSKVKNYSPIDKALFTDINTYLPDDLLPKVDIASMAVSLEARSPLLDHKFMELTAKMPSNLKVHGKSGKHIFKEALLPLLPRDILFRKKQGFSIPIDAWFRDSLHDYAKEIILGKNTLNSTIFKKGAVEALIYRHEQGSNEGRRIWLLLTLELWFQSFFKTTQ